MQDYFVQHKVFYFVFVQKLSNKQSAKVICGFDRLTTRFWNLSAAHALNYIVLRVNPGLTSCEDLATALGESDVSKTSKPDGSVKSNPSGSGNFCVLISVVAIAITRNYS